MSEDYYKEGDWNAVCSMCGRKRKGSELVRNWQGQWRCPEHNEPRHPQDFVKAKADLQTVPFDQPGTMANTSFVGGFCTPDGMSALPDAATPDCVTPDYISPMFDINSFANGIYPATNILFGVGNGINTAYPLTGANGVSVLSITGLSYVYRTDWQGTQTLYPTPRTNVLLYSEQFDNAAWSKTASGGTTAPVVTADAAIAPNGSMTADKVAYPSVSGVNAFSLLYQHPAQVSGVNTLSVWLRGDVGGEVVWLNATPNGATYVRVQCTLLTSWQRFSVQFTRTGADWYCQLGVDLRDSSESAKSAQTIYAWGAQLEQGSSATSYIATTSAAATITDYSFAGVTVTFAQIPLSGALLNWTGSYTLTS